MDAAALQAAMLDQISLDRAQREVAAANQALLAAGATTVNRAAMFLAQIGHESGSLRYATELASGQAYNGRKDLGNTYPGDGPRYKGRSYLQLTGRHNYGLFGQWAKARGLVSDQNYFVNNPDQVAQLPWVWLGPVWYWVVARPTLNAVSDAGDTTKATRLVNGGTNGLADRVARWNRCRSLGTRILPVGGAPGSGQAPTPAKPAAPPPPPAYLLQRET
jgi:putative chitinase